MNNPGKIDDLLCETGRRNTDLVAGLVIQKPELYEELVMVFLRNEEPVSRRAAWVVDILSETHPAFLEPYLDMITGMLPQFTHDALKRHSLRMIARSPLPSGDRLGELMNHCFDWILSPHEAIAVKVYCMEILYRISEVEPDMKKELADSIEWRLNEESAGFKNRGKKLLKKLYAEIEGTRKA